MFAVSVKSVENSVENVENFVHNRRLSDEPAESASADAPRKEAL